MSNDHSLMSRAERDAIAEAVVNVSTMPKEFSVMDLWKVFRRRLNVVVASTCMALVCGIAVTLATPRLYRAEAKLQILKQDAAAGLSDPAQASASAAADALDF